MTKTIILFLFLIFNINSISQTTTAQSSGDWDAVSWSNGVPTCGSHDVIVIPRGLKITNKNGTINLNGCAVTLIIEGELELERTGNGNEALLILGAGSSIRIEEPDGQIDAVSNKSLNGVSIEIPQGTQIWNGTDLDPLTATVVNQSGYQVPLPVDLVSFKAYAEQNEVVLVWVTASEINNDKFQIQKSKTGETYEIIETIDGQGTKNTPTEYIYKDKDPYKGLSFYRLIQTDFNGEFSETDVVAVDFKGNEDFEVELYPNPINQGHNLYLKVPTKEGQEFNVFVNDLLGKDYITDLTFINQGNSTLVILELSSTLPAGTYFINIVTSRGVTSKRVLVK